MTLSFCIPQEWIAYHVEFSNDIFGYEGEAPGYFIMGTRGAIFDTGDDNMMINHAISEDETMNPLEAAMSVNGYSRYWHGYLVWLRPLLILFQQWQIRYIYMMVFCMLFAWLLIRMAQTIPGGAGMPAAVALCVCFAAGYITVIPTCMQYAHVYFIAMIACIVLLRHRERLRPHLNLVFMVTGMVTSFVDFLTAPLLTLGVPLLVYLFADNQRETAVPLRSRMAEIVCCALLWGIGYVGCWAMKWAIGSAVLGQNIFKDAFDHIFGWTSDMDAGSRGVAFARNAEMYFLAQGKRVYIVFALPVAALLYRIVRHRNPQWRRALAYLLVGASPYLWYLVINGHSFYHPFFAHRIQTITALSICLFAIDAARWDGAGVQRIH